MDRFIPFWVIAFCLCCLRVGAQDLTELSLEDLMRVKVMSVTKRPEELRNAASAVYVISNDDIRRAGTTTLADSLALAPGMAVAHLDGHTWAITARGFNNLFSRDLLVLMDGRSVYTPLFSGVFWDVQDTMMEDLDRIEVVRGPGGTLWGANAVNGVVNIVTKSAHETQGLLISGGAGTEERGFTSIRYGGMITTGLAYRVYGKWFAYDDQVFANSRDANDHWYHGQGGFRMDWDVNSLNAATLQGDFYGGSESGSFLVSSTNNPPSFERYFSDSQHVAGGNLLGRWTHRGADSEIMVQSYYDRTDRELQTFQETRHTFDIDSQHSFRLGSRQQVTWGLGYRLSVNDTRPSQTLSFTPTGRTMNLYSGFVQDQIELVPNQWMLTVGTKLEHNDFTGFELQPSGRLAWMPTERQTVWAAVSRAVRTPSQTDEDIRFEQEPVPIAPGIVGTPVIHGNRGFASEVCMAYELGYRIQPANRVTFDVAAFYNVYDDLRSVETRGVDFGTVPPTIDLQFENRLHGQSYGGEAVARWTPADWWRLEAQYSLVMLDLGREKRSNDGDQGLSAPQNQVSLRSMVNLPGGWELDGWLRYVDTLPQPGVPSYWPLSIRLGWHINKNVELSIVGQNLLQDHHPEYSSQFTYLRTEIQRSAYVKLTYRF